jgi:hypothetical protein
MEFVSADWIADAKGHDEMRERAMKARRGVEADAAMETMSLPALLYYVLMGETAKAES